MYFSTTFQGFRFPTHWHYWYSSIIPSLSISGDSKKKQKIHTDQKQSVNLFFFFLNTMKISKKGIAGDQ